ncbi:MAG: SEC-C domain-containing protein [Acidobacteriota bacterium]
MIAFADQLRSELNPTGQLEEMFFSQIVNQLTLASYLMRHLEADPEFAHKESARRMRMLAANQRQTRYAYEELRRLQLARQLQREDPELANAPILTVVARNTSRNGYRAPRLSAAPLNPVAATPSRASAVEAARVTPGRNAQCPCNSGRKYKHCCANKQQAAA